MECVICDDLEQAFEFRRVKYIEALSSAYYRVSTELAASKQVDMECAKGALEEHQSRCATSISSPFGTKAGGRHREKTVNWAPAMGTYLLPLAQSYRQIKGALRYDSPSFLKSLMTAVLVGTSAAVIGVAASASLYYRDAAWYIAAAAGPLVDTVVVIGIATIALEHSRKRSIRRTVEAAFLNHHVHNALTHIVAASHVADAEKQERLQHEAINRISGALFRVAKSTDLDNLSLEVDAGGTELARSIEDRKKARQVRKA